MHSHNPNPPAPQPQDATLREEFNRWAGAGKGESMEQDHWPITRPVLAQMRIAPDDHILDLGCGAGWLSRILARGVPRGRVLGVDISDQMIRRAQEAMPAVAGPSPDAAANLEFRVGSVDAIPSDANSFTRIISVESAYYWPDPARGVREMFRVLRPGAPGRRGGSAWIVINYYRDNPHCHQWGAILSIPAHLLSAGEWARLFRDAGFAQVAHSRVPDPTPNPEVYTGRWFRDAAHLAAFRREGALLVHGTKP
ncbi:MAG TPA: class I SAM-dependent methyltransferase [Candidatus Acidoferrales bacterium]|nr:class I SAM-dependent methyltransferase [Candidatus Acidoferrales bacterium]